MTGYFLIVERICYVAITGLKPRQDVTVNVTREDGSTFSFTTTARLDGAIDVTYYENGGILLTVMRRLMKA
jgi:aconitate hydratase